jgi:folate-binding protein YgfZ
MKDDTQIKMIRLDDLTSLHVTGNDATKFLHAQFTNDLANLAADNWQYSGYCTPKGRSLAFMTIARLDENEFLLILPAEVSDKVLPRLRMFVMRDDVTITPQDENTTILGILHAVGNLPDLANTQVKENGKLGRDGENFLLTIDHESGRYLYIGDETKIDTDASADRNDWTLADIQSGIPAVVLATQEAYVPQMINLDLIGAVNFKKGCYPGQEIVARVHYLGKIKQRMYVVETDSKEQAQPNDKIYIADQPDKAAGTVVQAAMTDSNQFLQVVLQTKAIDEKLDLRLGTVEGEKLTMAVQPYSVTSGAD